MCVICDMEQLNKLHADASITLVKSLANCAADLIKALEAHKAEADTALIAKAKNLLRGIQKPDRQQEIVEMLQKAFPGAMIVTGSPEEVEAQIQKEAAEANGQKPN